MHEYTNTHVYKIRLVHKHTHIYKNTSIHKYTHIYKHTRGHKDTHVYTQAYIHLLTRLQPRYVKKKTFEDNETINNNKTDR